MRQTKPDNTILFEDARIVYRNFEGKEGQYNREGDRNFSLVLDTETAEKMRADNWNVKSKPPYEEGDEPFHTLSVSVSFRGRPPRLVMITSQGRTILDEETCEIIDWADIKTVDLIIRPYDWSVSGNTGRKAYLKTMYVTINEDALQLKYDSIPEAGKIVEGEVIRDWEDDK